MVDAHGRQHEPEQQQQHSRNGRHHGRRRTRLSLPSIQVSAPGSSSPSSSNHALLLSQSANAGAGDASGRRGAAHFTPFTSLGRTDTASTFANAGDITATTATTLNELRKEEAATASTTARDTGAKGRQSDASSTAAGALRCHELEPLLPADLMQRCQSTMAKCTEYERLCAQLEHSIEHKILIWSDILDKYESQDRTATEIREGITASLASLASAHSSIDSARESLDDTSGTLDRFGRVLEGAKSGIEEARVTMQGLERTMVAEEVVARKVEKTRKGLFTSAGILVAVLIVWLSWYISTLKRLV